MINNIKTKERRETKLNVGKLKCSDCGKILLDGIEYKPEEITGELIQYKIFDHRQECIATI